jgi:arabinogalactan endo-1,4-beta-galactosidase
MNFRNSILISLIFFLLSCNMEEENPAPSPELPAFISAVDISSYPEIAQVSNVFLDLEGNEKDLLDILHESGINTIRLRLWVQPSSEHSSFQEVKQFSEELKETGFRILLTVHYSDTWADPGQQETPSQWQTLSFGVLKDSVYAYTQKIMREIKPDYIQLGNEVNSGFLHPHGRLADHPGQFIELMETAGQAVRSTKPDAKIIVHYAGIEGANWFYDQIASLDYDIIGLSYYPFWHEKSLVELKNTLEYLEQAFEKPLLIAETAYPFTLAWNDWTHNIVGLEEQLILPDFPASPEGQRDFITHLKIILNELENGIGLCYWGSELIAWKGEEATDGSPWENQALFDFDKRELPVLDELGME